MSGGHFNYNQHFILDIIEEIEDEIERNNFCPPEITDMRIWVEEYQHQRYDKETIKQFKKAIKVLKKAYIYAQRIDWFFSGDDSEESFHRRLKEELEKL